MRLIVAQFARCVLLERVRLAKGTSRLGAELYRLKIDKATHDIALGWSAGFEDSPCY